MKTLNLFVVLVLAVAALVSFVNGMSPPLFTTTQSSFLYRLAPSRLPLLVFAP